MSNWIEHEGDLFNLDNLSSVKRVGYCEIYLCFGSSDHAYDLLSFCEEEDRDKYFEYIKQKLGD